MFCPNCGNPDQTAESYCRRCGEFLADFSSQSYLLNKLLGGQSPETQVTVNLIINLVTGLTSVLLLGFLNGYYDAQFIKTHVSPPPVLYLVYIFLGLVTVWQLFSFLVGMRLRSKIVGRRPMSPAESADNIEGEEMSALPEANRAGSITEDPTRMLDRVPRNEG